MGKEFRGISENSADASATTVQNIPDSPDISLNDVSFTSMTVHMETVYAADKNVTGDVPGFRTTVPWIVRMPRMSTSLDWTKPQILSLAGRRIRRNQRKLGGRQCNHRTEYSRSPDISLNDVSFTSMTVHMETVYAADKNVTRFRCFLEPATGG
jgi:predicted rRNA methylase YqxC with S4 and FtsJ domains